MYSTFAEMFAESIPAGVLQAFAYIQSPKRTTAALVSILISALTTGFGSALISYGKSLDLKGADMLSIIKRFLTPRVLLHTADVDTSPKKRREAPEFYGFVPPTGRGLVFILMMVNSTAQFLAKILSIALLGAVSVTWALAYILGDAGLYIIYTLVRNDFFYYLPTRSFIGSIGMSIFMRSAEKVREQVGCLKIATKTLLTH